MSQLPVSAVASAPVSPAADAAGERHLRVIGAHEHAWRLRETLFEDGARPLRRFECGCGAVDFD